MGDVIPFKKKVTRIQVPILWGEGMFGFNPNLIEHICIADETMICLFFHKEEDNLKDSKGWELCVRCHDAEEAQAAYNDLVHILEESYGVTLGDEK